MTQEERMNILLEFLLSEASLPMPDNNSDKKQLLRGLWNVRPPHPVPQDILALQDEFLQEENGQKGIVRLEDLQSVHPGNNFYLWQGDITRLGVDAIVNAANSALLGCFVPCHACIDNAIHSAAGVGLRLECAQTMQKQGHPEETGKAKLTKGYNLPAKYVLHTVGPIIQGALTKEDCEQLAACYFSCLSAALQNGIHSIAFCCISTGEFHFPQQQAAEIAINAVRDFLSQGKSDIQVIFNVFAESDMKIYKKLL